MILKSLSVPIVALIYELAATAGDTANLKHSARNEQTKTQYDNQRKF